MQWRVPVAVILGPACFLTAFLAEGVTHDASAIAVMAGAVGASFLLARYLLSRGQAHRDRLRILVALDALPSCMGIVVALVERTTGAWIQRVLIVAVGLVCSLAGAALAGRSARTLRDGSSP